MIVEVVGLLEEVVEEIEEIDMGMEIDTKIKEERDIADPDLEVNILF